MKRKLTIKEKVLNLLCEGTPMLSLDMARVLRLDKSAASQAAKDLHGEGLLHIVEWRKNVKNGGNKVYAYGKGVDVARPEPKLKPRPKPKVVHIPKVFVPRLDEAAAWMRNPI